jgi:hypothetical protein
MATSARRIVRTVGFGVSSSYSNGRTLINRARIAAETSPIRFVIGHGLLEPDVEERRVPKNTYVIFLSKPGQLLSVREAYQLYTKSLLYIRSALMGRIRSSQIDPYRLSKWTSHVYGPNEKYPNLMLKLFDSNPQSILSQISGMTKLEIGKRQYYGQHVMLNQLMIRGGPGIYIVAACRASAERAPRAAQVFEANVHPNRSRITVRSGSRVNIVNKRGTQQRLRLPSNAPSLNLSVAELERAQKRRAAHKRSGSKLPNSLPAKNVYFSFNPGSTNTGLKKNGKRIFQRSNGVYFIMNGRLLTIVSSNVVNAARRLATRRRSR